MLFADRPLIGFSLKPLLPSRPLTERWLDQNRDSLTHTTLLSHSGDGVPPVQQQSWQIVENPRRDDPVSLNVLAGKVAEQPVNAFHGAALRARPHPMQGVAASLGFNLGRSVQWNEKGVFTLS